MSFRAPMTSHNNIRLLKVVHTEQMDEFYKYMTTPTIFNSWDTCADAMNGFDKDLILSVLVKLGEPIDIGCAAYA